MNKENLIPQYVDHYSYYKITEVKRTRHRILSDIDANAIDKPQPLTKMGLTPNIIFENGRAEKRAFKDGNNLNLKKILPSSSSCNNNVQIIKRKETIKKQLIVKNAVNPFYLRNSINMHVVAFNMKPGTRNIEAINEYRPLKTLEEMITHAAKISLSMKYFKILKNNPTAHTCTFSFSLLWDIIHTNGRQPSKYLVDKDYLINFNYSQNVRNDVVNWLYKLQNFLGVDSIVIFSSVRLFDYVISKIYVHEDLLQLVALTLFWILHKLDNDRMPFLATNLVTFSNGIYTKYNILDMEMKLLKALDYNILIPDVTIYIEFYVFVCPFPQKEFLKRCATYILECYIFSKDFSVILEVYLGLVAVKIAIDALCERRHIWEQLTFIKWKLDFDMLRTIESRAHNQVIRMQHEDFRFRAPFNKYAKDEYSKVSLYIKQQLNLINRP